MNKGQKKLSLETIIFIAVWVALFVALLVLLMTKYAKRGISSEDREGLKRGDYEAVFIHMHGIDAFDADLFSAYRGLNVYIPKTNGDTFRRIDELLTEGLSPKACEEIYIEIDPYELKQQAGRNRTRFDTKMYDNFFEHIATNPGTVFDVVLSFPSVEYWEKLSKEEITKREDIYFDFAKKLDAYGNVFLFFPGAEEWLIANSGNYESDYNTAEDASVKLMCNMFCDRAGAIKSSNISNCFDNIRFVAGNSAYGLYDSLELENTDIVFMGDSLFDYYRTVYSVSANVGLFTGANIYDISEGGTTASGKAGDSWNFKAATDFVLGGGIPEAYAEASFYNDAVRFSEDNHEGRNLIFIMLYGFNDYMEGRPIESKKNPKDINTLKGAMISNIEAIKEKYADARFLWVVPYDAGVFSGVKSPYSKDGSGYGYGDYVNAEYEVLESIGIEYVDLYRLQRGFFSEDGGLLVADNIHPSAQGAFVIAKDIVSKLREK